MREEIARVVHGVIGEGLRLKERVERNRALDLRTEQSKLMGLLLSEDQARRWTDYGSDKGTNTSVLGSLAPGDAHRQARETFLGIRYALVAWLDEIFITDSSWATQWNGNKLETALYGTNNRADWFWEQARLAEARPGGDALEVFYLCVMLGFRGERRNDPEKLQAWVAATQGRIAGSRPKEAPLPSELDPATNVPPRRALESLKKMLFLGVAVVLFLIPIGVFLLLVGSTR